MVFSISYNPAESAVLVVTRVPNLDHCYYELHSVPSDVDSLSAPTEASDGKRTPGVTAIWVSRSRIAVLDRNHTVHRFPLVGRSRYLVLFAR